MHAKTSQSLPKMPCQASFWSPLLVNRRKPSAGSLHSLASLDIEVAELGGPTTTSVHPGSRKAKSSEVTRFGREIKREERLRQIARVIWFLLDVRLSFIFYAFVNSQKGLPLKLPTDDDAQAGALLALVDFRNWQVKVGSVFSTHFHGFGVDEREVRCLYSSGRNCGSGPCSSYNLLNPGTHQTVCQPCHPVETKGFNALHTEAISWSFNCCYTGVAMQRSVMVSTSVPLWSWRILAVDLRRLVVCDHQTCHIIDVERRQCEQASAKPEKPIASCSSMGHG